MLRLLRLVHLPFWRRHPLQAALPILGIAVGVGAIVAIDLGSGSTVSSFRFTTERLSGRTTHQVLAGPSPITAAHAVALRRLDGVRAAAPWIETVALAAEPLRLIGVDPLAEGDVRALGIQDESLDLPAANERFLRLLGEPGALLVSEGYLRRQALEPGDPIDLAVGARPHRAFVLDALPRQVAGLPVPDGLAICDLSTAQELTGRTDVGRIDLVVDPENSREVLSRVRALLPVGTRIERPGGAARYLETLVSALQLNLRALSYLALFVSLFLIYNAMLLAVLRRRPALGVLRCLGASRREVLAAWLVEAMLIGAAGTAIGLLLGIGAGRWALGGIARTASDLYGYVRAEQVTLTAAVLVKATVVGLTASFMAAFLPAAEAATTAPARTASRGAIEVSSEARLRRAAWAALPLAALAVLSLGIESEGPIPGYVAAISVALGTAVLVPFLGSALLRALQRLLGAVGGTVTELAARNIRASLSRTGVAMAALTVALSMSIAMGTMVSSFRLELRDWIADNVRADVYLSPATARVDRFGARLDAELVDALRARSDVAAVDTYRGLPARVAGFETVTAGVDVGVFRTRATPRIVDGPSPGVFLDRLERGEAGVSETLMRRVGLRPGQRFTLSAAGRDVEVQVAGVYRDYSSDRGVVLLDRRTFAAAFGELQPNSVALYFREGVDAAGAVETLRSDLAGRWALEIRTNEGLREEADEVFTRTFAVAGALEVIGIGVAAIGILAALSALLLERGRELATLRALGLTRRQLRRLLLSESFLLAFLAWLFALLCGGSLAWILLNVINVRSFGWLLPLQWPVDGLLLNLLWALLAAGLAALLPVRASRTLSIAQSLREE